MSPDGPSNADLSELELAEIEALRTEAVRQLSRRKLLRRAAWTLAWTTPVIESLAIAPEESEAQGMKKDMTMKPMMVMLLGPG